MTIPRNLFRDSALEARFVRDGYVVCELLGDGALARLRAAHRPPADIAELPFYSSAMSADFDYRRRASAAIKAAVRPRLEELLIGVEPIYGQFFDKRPDDKESEVHIHQDWSFVDESRHRSVTVWCPLVDTDETSGCLAVVPGSQMLNPRPRGYVDRFPYPDLAPLLIKEYSVHLPVRAGEAVLFDQRLFHWSRPNLGPGRRPAVQCLCASTGCPLLYPHADEQVHPGEVELFEVDAMFFTEFLIGVRPRRGVSHGHVDARPEPQDAESLARVLGQGARG